MGAFAEVTSMKAFVEAVVEASVAVISVEDFISSKSSIEAFVDRGSFHASCFKESFQKI